MDHPATADAGPDDAPLPRGGTGWLRAAFQEAPVGMALVGLDGRVLRANRALGNLLGVDTAALIATPVQAFAHPEDVGTDLLPLWMLAIGELGACQVERRVVHPDGRPRWALLSAALVRDGAGRPACFVLHAQDVTERRTREDRLRHRALHDPLTGLPNRTLFADRLGHALEGAAARGEAGSVAVLLLDLDGFKAVNDGLGHDAGDRLLIAVGKRLAACLRAGDLAARVGGDEFALLIERTRGRGDAAAVAERVLAALREPVPLGGHEAAIAASIGIARSDGDPARASDLLRAADLALYWAKAAGGATYAVFDGDVHGRVDNPSQRPGGERPRITAWLNGVVPVGA